MAANASEEYLRASDPHRLVALYADMGRLLLEATDEGRDTLAAVTQLAVTAIPGVEQASISQGRGGYGFRTVASTGELATAVDQIQYDLRSGPCVDAMTQGAVFRTGDLAGDARWPGFARAATEHGVASMLSLRLYLEGDDRIAGLNLYSTRPDAFTDDAEVVADVVATHSAVALLAAAARERAGNLERALDSNRRIGMAMGILMVTHRVTDDDAFSLLRMASQTANRKLLDIAEDVVTTGALELPDRPARRSTAAKPPPPE